MTLFGYGQPGAAGEILAGVPHVVIDLETTGLEPEEDRIIEIAMGRVENGHLVDEWATLIDPGRDPGPTFLHHISAGMLSGAPVFQEVAGEILARLDGAIVVAHHAPFEEGFLEAELARLGIVLEPMPALCTLQLSRVALASPNYKLATCCAITGIDLRDAHTALGDVRATALLLPKLLLMAPRIGYPVVITPMPRHQRLVSPRTRVTNLRKGEEGWMRSLLSKLPYSMSDHDPTGADPYLDSLTEAIADGKLTKDETRRLGRIAGRAGMGAAQVTELHRRFLDGLRDAALVDDYVTIAELEVLTTAAGLLDQPGYFDDVTAEDRVEPLTGPRVWCGPTVPDEIKRRIISGGYRLVANVSRGLAAAVVGTGDHGPKLQRAVELGVPVIPIAHVDTMLTRLPVPVAPAGWYTDPAGRFTYRYWSGEAWSHHASPGDGSSIIDPL